MLIALGLVVAAVGTALTVVLLAREPSQPAAVSAVQARAAAERSCAQAARFELLVRENAPLDEVRQALGRAERDAEAAARGDATWVALAGGVQTVRVALDADDERAARVGIDVVRSECRRTTD